MAIQRLNYFTGQFLRENDFNLEQGYHLSMRRRHNKNAHTPGIVYGLEVVAGTSQVTVKAGMAIDKDGREMVLEADTALPISATDGNTYVVIALEEKKTDPAVAPDPIKLETRWTESALPTVVIDVPAGAVGLAKIDVVAANGAVTLKSDYRRIYSAPVAGGDLIVGRDLTVNGNLEVRGQTTLIETDQMRGNVVLGDADTDTVTVEGSLLTGHSSGQLQIASPVTMTRNLAVQGNVVLGDADADTVTVEGSMVTGHTTGKLKIASPVDVVGDIAVSGSVDGRDVSADGSKLDSHVASTSNPHVTTAAQVDTQGGANSLVAQINVGTGVIAAARIDSAIARETRFNTATGHDHDGTDSKKISPSDLAGVNASVTAANLNVLTAGPTSNAAALHTHPFAPADRSVTLAKLDPSTRSRLLRVPLLAQIFSPPTNVSLGSLSGGIAFDGTRFWVADYQTNAVLKIDPATNLVVTMVAVDSNPFGLAFGGGYLWVASWGTSSVSKIDVATSSVVASISVGSGPNALAVSGAFLWVANYYADNVSKIDMATNAVVASVPVGTNPAGLAVVGSFLWAANSGSNTVSKIDMATNSVVATVSVGSQPRGLAAATGTFLWVANYAANTLSKVDVGANTVVATVPVANVYPSALAVIGGFLWVGGNQVQKVDTATNTVVATIPAYVGNWGAAMPSVSGFLWVAGSNQVTKVDVTANTVAATLLTGESRGMAFDGLYLWVAVYGTVQVLQVDIDTGQVVRSVTVGTRPHSVVYNGKHIFVTNFGSNSVSKIDPLTGSVLATIPVGANPAGIAYNPFYRTLWVANSGDGTVSVFDENATSVGATSSVGSNPQGVACENQFVWVTNTGGNTVTRRGAWVGGGDTVYATIVVGAAPQAIVFDSSNMWVANTGANSLSKIAANSSTATSVALPAGALPARMCFNGSHLLVQCTNGQAYRIDIYTNAVLPMTIPWYGSTTGPLLFDGVSAWQTYSGGVARAPV
ncbi:MAG: hypothetical protein IPK02_10245 [Candidatus Accumulibacter sp.]|uniref:YncE family protein n=1 Tax=Candidatus Accumulibacter affinis TaxID=2954384 RepID=A0A935T9L2_9PROT|nr:hypothetical protein [Candidatus Accumulibacter affinis]